MNRRHPIEVPQCVDRRGFTLMELIIVIGIIGVISVLAMPSAGKLLGASQVTQGAQMLVNELSLARQQAITRNCEVEVRIYQFGDPDVPGEMAANPDEGKYRAFQAFEITDSGTVAFGKIHRLPSAIMIDSGMLSSIINASQALPAMPMAMTGNMLNTPIPKVGTQYNAVCFRFLPDGSAKLSPRTGNWYLTLHEVKSGDALATPPPNFFTLQINAFNGHIQTFRP